MGFPSGTAPLLSVPANGTLTFTNLSLSGLAFFQTQSLGLLVPPPEVSLGPGARLLLHDVAVLTPSCSDFAAQQLRACQLSPSPNFTVMPGSLIVHRLSSTSVELVNVQFTCGSEIPVPCVAATVHSGQQLVDAVKILPDLLQQHGHTWLDLGNRAAEFPLYLFVPHEISFQGVLTPYMGPHGSPSALPEPISPGKLVIGGLAKSSHGVPGGPEVDLAGLPYLLPLPKLYGQVELYNLTLTNLPYGASRDYPDGMFGVFVWTFDLMRKAFGSKLARRLSLQGVQMRVATQEVAVWLQDALQQPPPAPLDRLLCARTSRAFSVLNGSVVPGAGASGGPALLVSKAVTLGGLMTLENVLVTDQASSIWAPLPEACGPDALADAASYVCSAIGGGSGVNRPSFGNGSASGARVGLACSCRPPPGPSLQDAVSPASFAAVRAHPLCLMAPVNVTEVTLALATRSAVTTIAPIQLVPSVSAAELARTPWALDMRIFLKSSVTLVTEPMALPEYSFLMARAAVKRPTTILGDPFRPLFLDFNRSAEAAIDLRGGSASLTLRAVVLSNLPSAALHPTALLAASPPGTTSTASGSEAAPPQAAALAAAGGPSSPPTGPNTSASAAVSDWETSVTQGLPAGLANLTSCMWPFFFDRAAGLLTADEGPSLLAPFDDCNAAPGDADGSAAGSGTSGGCGGSGNSSGVNADLEHLRLPRAYIESVTVVVHPVEVALMAWVLAMGSPVGVADPATAAYIGRALLERSEVAGGATSRQLLATAVDPGWLCNPSGSGGDRTTPDARVRRLTFARLEWCGVFGRNVTFEAAPASLDASRQWPGRPRPQLPLDCAAVLAAGGQGQGQGPPRVPATPMVLKEGRPPGQLAEPCDGAACEGSASRLGVGHGGVAIVPVAVGVGVGLVCLGLLAAVCGLLLWRRVAARQRPAPDCEAPVRELRANQAAAHDHCAAADASPAAAAVSPVPEACGDGGGGGACAYRCDDAVEEPTTSINSKVVTALNGHLGAGDGCRVSNNECYDGNGNGDGAGVGCRTPTQGSEYYPRGITEWLAGTAAVGRSTDEGYVLGSGTGGDSSAVAAVPGSDGHDAFDRRPLSSTPGMTQSSDTVSLPPPAELARGLARLYAKVDHLREGLMHEARPSRFMRAQSSRQQPQQQSEQERHPQHHHRRGEEGERARARRQMMKLPSAGSLQSLRVSSQRSASACVDVTEVCGPQGSRSQREGPTEARLLGTSARGVGNGGSGGLDGGRASEHGGDAATAACVAETEYVWGIGGLQLLAELGRGANGVVYRGRWRELDVAVKSFLFLQGPKGSSRSSGSSAAGRRAVQEAALSLCCSHRNLVATYTYALRPLASATQRSDPVGAPPRAAPVPVHGNPSQGLTGLERPAKGEPRGVVVRDVGGLALEPQPLAAAWRLLLVQELCDGNSLRHCLLTAALEAETWASPSPTRAVSRDDLAAAIGAHDGGPPIAVIAASHGAGGVAAPAPSAQPRLVPSDPTACANDGPQPPARHPLAGWREAPGSDSTSQRQSETGSPRKTVDNTGCKVPEIAIMVEPAPAAAPTPALPLRSAAQSNGAPPPCGDLQIAAPLSRTALPVSLPPPPPRARPVPVRFALILALDIARGMAHMHSCGVAHGDLSSSNVLLSRFTLQRRSRPRLSLLPRGYTGSGSADASGGASTSRPDEVGLGRQLSKAHGVTNEGANGPTCSPSRGTGSSVPGVPWPNDGTSQLAACGDRGGSAPAASLPGPTDSQVADAAAGAAAAADVDEPISGSQARGRSGRRRRFSAGQVPPEGGAPDDLALDYCREAWGLGFVAKVCDFGLASRLEDQDHTHLSAPGRSFCLYNAPELARFGTCNRATDVYAFALVMWELATGVPLPEALETAPHLQAWLHGRTAATLLHMQPQPHAPREQADPEQLQEAISPLALPPQLLAWPAGVPPAYRHLAAACLNERASERPTFADICIRLEEVLWSLAAGDQATAAAVCCPTGGISKRLALAEGRPGSSL